MPLIVDRLVLILEADGLPLCLLHIPSYKISLIAETMDETSSKFDHSAIEFLSMNSPTNSISGFKYKMMNLVVREQFGSPNTRNASSYNDDLPSDVLHCILMLKV
jgi:hypothetical protein